ncbi:MAG: oxidoreductase [Acidimicrobiia bacterium]|nr:oxidoreductase [Acidimicrobiia bacterium]
MTRARIATAWLGGCSGCHMSFLDMDEWLFELADVADLVYSPIADVKVFPEDVDVTFVEGALANEDNLREARHIRENSRLVVAFGDCAVSGNVTAMRNPLGDPIEIVKAVYVDAPDRDGQIPKKEGIVPPLLPQVLPIHKAIRVDAFLPGCPPPADRIQAALEALLEGALPPNRGEAIRWG